MKKYLYFIVEGSNDKIEIQAILRAACGQSFFENYVDDYHVHRGDITTELDTSERTIIKKLTGIVINWRKGNGHPYNTISPVDVKKIIHVVDTDGAFIPEQAVYEKDVGEVRYNDQTIDCLVRADIIGRNRKKARVIKKLLETEKIDNIPYEIYFTSCNMDHLLFNERNPIQKDKNMNSRIFALKCKSRDDLQDSVFAHGICACGSVIDSWDMIKNDFNSLARHSNLNLLLEGIIRTAE